MNILGVQMQDKTALIIGGVVLVLGYLAVKKTAETLDKVGEAFNPFNSQNIFYRGTNEVGAVITGDDSFNLGSWMWDALHPNESAGTTSIKLPTSGGGNNGGATGSW